MYIDEGKEGGEERKGEGRGDGRRGERELRERERGE